MDVEPCDFDTISQEEFPQAVRIAEYLHARGARTICDVGCGPGIYVTAMRTFGLKAYGVDHDPRLPADAHFIRTDIASEMWKREPVDVTLSLEVGEHLPEDKADAYVRYLASTGCSTLYFSAARPGQGGHGHINCHPKSYWTRKLHAVGFYVDPDETDAWLGFMRGGYHMGWLTQNGMVFRRF